VGKQELPEELRIPSKDLMMHKLQKQSEKKHLHSKLKLMLLQQVLHQKRL
jgi:hypothetical protein